MVDIVYCNGFDEASFTETMRTSCFVMPSVSYANVDQMTIDLLLYNAQLCDQLIKIAVLHSKYILPIVGGSPFLLEGTPASGMTTALELFLVKNAGLVVLQQRSQPLDFMAEPFSKEMMSFVCSFCPRSLLFVCAANSTFYDSSQFKDVIAYYTTSSSVLEKVGDAIPSINLPHEEVSGGGLLPFFLPLAIASKIPYTAFVSFVTEGRNFEDAIAFFKRINQSLHLLTVEEIQVPPTWSVVDNDAL
ncbi:hypothetical protein WA577_004136, partial [Blastocystis sp. JDR]